MIHTHTYDALVIGGGGADDFVLRQGAAATEIASRSGPNTHPSDSITRAACQCSVDARHQLVDRLGREHDDDAGDD